MTEGYFALKGLGMAQIKGVEEPLNVYEVLGAGPFRTKLQVAMRRGLTRFVGRQSELDQLRQALEQAKAGHGQIVGVMGEPGLGKSRLFYEFKLTSQNLFVLLGIEDPTSPLQQMDAQIRRRRTFDAVKKLFLRESLNQPLLLIFEDLPEFIVLKRPRHAFTRPSTLLASSK